MPHDPADLRAITISLNDEHGIGGQSKFARLLGWHHSTVWRMLTWLGLQSAALVLGRQQIQERHPGSTCHRFLGAVAPQKFRSPQREQLLRRARQLLYLVVEWERLLAKGSSPASRQEPASCEVA